ncbi:hypothetical protein M0R72_10120 [Candidatus Pacearchaeota archaeon]|nr:hypothetical protein [Candidatus Pacearchaeota archaeon]
MKTAVTKADAAVDNAVGNAVTVAAKTSAGSEAGSLGIQAAMRVFQERGQADLVQQLAPFIGNLWAYVPPPVSTVTVSTPVAVVTTTGETVQVNPAPAVTAT